MTRLKRLGRLVFLVMIVLLACSGIALADHDPYAEVRSYAAELADVLLRSGRRYYSVYELPISQYYGITDAIRIKITTAEEPPGYVGPYRILDANTAIQDVQIPVSGRDNIDPEIFVIDGKEYLLAAGGVYLSENDMEELQTGENITYTILSDGYARWFTVNEQDAGKTMTVALPKGGSFAVYDAEDVCVHFSVMKGNQPVQLPENGKIVFAGESPGDRFAVTIK